jgi:hypothetical protein
MSDTVSRSFTIQNVDHVHFSALGNVRLIQGEEESLLAEGSSEALEHIKVEQEGSHLHIRLYTWYDFMFIPRPASYTLKVKNLDGFSISGSAEVDCDKIQSQKLELSISGSGRYRIREINAPILEVSSSGSGNYDLAQVTANEVSAGFSGSGNYRLAGTADRLNVRISGSGEVDSGQLAVRREDIHISGAARVVAQVSDELEIHISGSGEIVYQGSPQIRQSISGNGTIRKL